MSNSTSFPEPLPASDFLTVLANTPLLAFDLLLRDPQERVLLGLRSNRPAQGYWFVPGGRVLKDERLEDAFLRITAAELGQSIPLTEGKFMGVYQHFYADNFSGRAGISTHYVVLGVELRLAQALLEKPLAQHSDWRWWSVEDLLISPEVHPNTRAYFNREQKTRALYPPFYSA
ncbi:ADP-ribose pyrophosphatase [Longilinea arvoryzae]|uniref:ADP-ribose pyrophosphatase n=1 Tax=Longilinea arvoryzae TaxID=360412 RepID=A0A0S7BJK6_9CHLR|nr:GDP-mannose mannosyl hydrolase [Longilinea arvoryzae]GAP14123.1 ADP-ribose pyrophosphatase [Longilinea arvoryzae]